MKQVIEPSKIKKGMIIEDKFGKRGRVDWKTQPYRRLQYAGLTIINHPDPDWYMLVCACRCHRGPIGKEFTERFGSCSVCMEDHKDPKDNMEDCYVCPAHVRTGGYEACCSCEGDRLCTEAQI